MKKEEIRKSVRDRYAEVAVKRGPCCGEGSSGCGTSDPAEEIGRKIGYSKEELKSVPEGSNLGLGCGNPVAIASLKEGDTVVDLGSGPGLDCFLAADRVGTNGKVIGIDMTPEMIETARANAVKGNYVNVEFRLGEIEHLPVADNSVDVVISNCVINLSPDKQSVFREAFRVLKPGGRIMISDIVLSRELPDSVKASIDAYTGCIAGALMKDAYLNAVAGAGFREVGIVSETSIPVEEWFNDPIAGSVAGTLEVSPAEAKEVPGALISAKVSGVK